MFVCDITFAQDSRAVTEPRFPGTTCAPLQARLGGPITESDEGNLDTKRVQRTIDSCPSGQSVVLAPDNARTAFLSGSLSLRSGVTLVISKGVTLYASRDPRVFDVKPGTCGIVTESSRGCKPLLGGVKSRNAAVMGEGTIDGRGGANLLGQSVSWWDLA